MKPYARRPRVSSKHLGTISAGPKERSFGARHSFDQAACRRDDFPVVGASDLTDYLPFLSPTS